MTLVYIFTFIVAVLVFAQWSYRKGIRDARDSGLYPPEGTKCTDEHVRSLLRAGEKILAIKAYREVYGVGLKEAKEAVEKYRV